MTPPAYAAMPGFRVPTLPEPLLLRVVDWAELRRTHSAWMIGLADRALAAMAHRKATQTPEERRATLADSLMRFEEP